MFVSWSSEEKQRGENSYYLYLKTKSEREVHDHIAKLFSKIAELYNSEENS